LLLELGTYLKRGGAHCSCEESIEKGAQAVQDLQKTFVELTKNYADSKLCKQAREQLDTVLLCAKNITTCVDKLKWMCAAKDIALIAKNIPAYTKPQAPTMTEKDAQLIKQISFDKLLLAGESTIQALRLLAKLYPVMSGTAKRIDEKTIQACINVFQQMYK
jgi:phage terminase Nu1 subunit (DNA packaging protein)